MKKIKTYYSTADIMELYDISERTIRYRLVELADKYKGRPTIFSKQNKKWKIHNSIIEQFAPKRNHKN